MFNPFTYIVYLTLLFGIIILSYTSFHRKIFVSQTTIFQEINKFELNFFHFTALLAISFVVGFRYDVGVDWKGYTMDFYSIASEAITFSDQYYEPGYYFLNKIVSIFGLHYTIMFFIVAFISWYFIFKSFNKQILPFVIFFIFADEYFFWSMNGVRQFAAMSLFLFSIKYIVSHNLKQYLILISCAAMFHYSAIALIVIYFIPYEKLYNQYIWGGTFVASYFMSGSKEFVLAFYWILVRLSDIIPGFEIYARYLIYERFFNEVDVETGLGYIFRLIIFFVILVFGKKVVEKYPHTSVYFILFFIGSVIFNLFYHYQIIGRINNYFIFMRSISMALIAYYMWPRKDTRMISVAIIVLYFVLFLSQIYHSSNMCNPYKIEIRLLA